MIVMRRVVLGVVWLMMLRLVMLRLRVVLHLRVMRRRLLLLLLLLGMMQRQLGATGIVRIGGGVVSGRGIAGLGSIRQQARVRLQDADLRSSRDKSRRNLLRLGTAADK